MGIDSLVIPAAGLGTRMRVVDPRLPKELLQVGSKPAIQYAVEEGVDVGVERIFVIISAQKERIKRHLSCLACPITYLYQQQPRGEIDAISQAEPLLKCHCFAIIYPDNLYLPAPGALRRLAEVYDKYSQDVVALSPVIPLDAECVSNSGRVDLSRLEANIYRIRRFHRKEPGPFRPRFPEELRACGIMVTGMHFFTAIRYARPAIGDEEFTDGAVRNVILERTGMLGVRLPGRVFDIGNPAGYAFCLRYVNHDMKYPG
jgi:UTP--glucose-1-phosphate uridylyltransferase